MKNTFADFHIQLNSLSGEEVTTTCPQCSAKRKNSKAKCLSVNTLKGVWVCHHCDWRGTLKEGEQASGRKIYVKPVWGGANDQPGKASNLPQVQFTRAFAYLRARGIDDIITEQEEIRQVNAYLPSCEAEVACLAFPYRKNGEVVNVKYRALDEKAFRQIAGAEKILYRQDRIATEYVIITEGEIDCLSLLRAGYDSCVSVPDGAPAPNTKNYAAKFTYLDQMPDPFEKCEKIILAVDADEPGRVLEQELGRRLGTDRCWRVRWPAGCKDANEVLMKLGLTAVQEAMASATPFPVQDVVTVDEMLDSMTARYFSPPRRGLSTGWQNVDELYTVEPGQLTVVSGIPGHGKSEVLDAIMMNLATLYGWRFAVCSPENSPVEIHIEKLLEKQTGLPFRVGPTERMDTTQLLSSLSWLNEQFCFIVPEEALSIAGVLDRAAILVRRLGIRGLVIDPYNEFDHTRKPGMSETEYIGMTLGLMKRWARKWQVHVWLVAHPMKLFPEPGEKKAPVPTLYDINGSANFRNKADCGIIVYRDELNGGPVEIHVQKIRFKNVGRVGKAYLNWDRVSGRYTDSFLKTERKA